MVDRHGAVRHSRRSSGAAAPRVRVTAPARVGRAHVAGRRIRRGRPPERPKAGQTLSLVRSCEPGEPRRGGLDAWPVLAAVVLLSGRRQDSRSPSCAVPSPGSPDAAVSTHGRFSLRSSSPSGRRQDSRLSSLRSFEPGGRPRGQALRTGQEARGDRRWIAAQAAEGHAGRGAPAAEGGRAAIAGRVPARAGPLTRPESPAAEGRRAATAGGVAARAGPLNTARVAGRRATARGDRRWGRRAGRPAEHGARRRPPRDERGDRRWGPRAGRPAGTARVAGRRATARGDRRSGRRAGRPADTARVASGRRDERGDRRWDRRADWPAELAPRRPPAEIAPRRPPAEIAPRRPLAEIAPRCPLAATRGPDLAARQAPVPNQDYPPAP